MKKLYLTLCLAVLTLGSLMAGPVDQQKAQRIGAKFLSTTTLASSGNTIAWTADGSDPRYSNTATVGTSVASAPSGATIKAYAYKDGAFPSAVAEFKLA